MDSAGLARQGIEKYPTRAGGPIRRVRLGVAPSA